MAYIGTEPKDVRSFGRAKFDYTATQGQTAFTGADDDGKTLGFTDGQIEVFVNGILMDDSDFSTSNGNTVTLASAANLNDIISIVAMQTDIPNSDYVPASGGTFSGDVTHSGAVTNSSTTTMTGDLSVTGADVTITGSTNTDATLNVLSPNWVTGAYADINIAHQPTSRKIRGHYDNGIEIFTNNANAALKVDPSGRVTMPYQPMFHAWCTDGGNGAVAAGSSPTSFYASLNVGSHFSSGTFTAPIAGKYRFYASVLSGAANGGYGLYQFTVNNSGSFGGGINNNWGQVYNYATGNDKAMTKELIVDLAANDYVKMELHSTYNNFYWGGGYSYFGGHLIG